MTPSIHFPELLDPDRHGHDASPSPAGSADFEDLSRGDRAVTPASRSHAPPAQSRGVVFSLFPGIDLFGRGFTRAGYSVVKGPDLILDERIEDFTGYRGFCQGIIAGPPCQPYSDANRNRDEAEGDRMLLQLGRVIVECMPEWWLIENVRNIPDVVLSPYIVQRLPITDVECGGVQRRLRHLQFGSLDGSIIRPTRTTPARSVTGRKAILCRPSTKHQRHSRRAEAQGAEDLSLRSLTSAARARAIGNAVTSAVAHTLARAVTDRRPRTEEDCICGCGRRVAPPARHAGSSCRKRMERRRAGVCRALIIGFAR